MKGSMAKSTSLLVHNNARLENVVDWWVLFARLAVQAEITLDNVVIRVKLKHYSV